MINSFFLALSDVANNSNPITMDNMVILGGIIGGIIGFVHLLINVGDRLWKKGEIQHENENAQIERVLAVYSESIKNLIAKQLEQIQQQNETIKEMITSFRASSEDSKLRHEIIMNNLRMAEKSDDILHQKLDKMSENIFYAKKTAYKEEY